MKRLFLLMCVLGLLTGCINTSDVHIDPGQIVGCMAECLLDTLWVEVDGTVFPVIPADYEEWVFKAGD